MRDLINKLNNIAIDKEVNELLEAAGINTAIYEEVGNAEITADTTDEQIVEAVANMFSNWKN
jgi:hypothetical protein